jgi:hypothetical protein
MHRLEKLRQLSSKYRRWHSLEKFIDRIDLVCEVDMRSAISNSNSLIETILKTILYERVKDYQEDTSKLKNAGVKKLATDALKSIDFHSNDQIKFISGLITAIQNLGSIRNGFSHGRHLQSEDEEKTDEISTLFLLQSVETIACFLIDFYEIEYPLISKTDSAKYDSEKYAEFNDWLDEEYGTVIVADVPIMASVALFTDLIAYQGEYQKYLSKDEEID